MTMGSPARPKPSSPAAHNRMVANRGKNTKPELLLRSALHRMGLRFYVDRPVIEGSRRRADIVFPRTKVAVFVDGCFWHGCPIHGTQSKSNSAFWTDKIRTNQIRDQDTNHTLESIGWLPIRIWEHELAEEAAQRILAIVRSRTTIAKPSSKESIEKNR